MIKHFPVEFVYQIFALIFAAILVHGAYVSVVRPNAEAQLAEQRALVAQQPDAEVESSVYVVLKDYEQEACFVLMLWALAILSYKWAVVLRERGLLEDELLPLTEGIKILPEDARRAIQLREIDGLSYKEIAAALGIPKGTVMSRLYYARRRLQEALRAAGVDPFEEGGGAEETA